MDQQPIDQAGDSFEGRPHLFINRAHLKDLFDHLQSEYPLEGCGLLAGNAGRIIHLYPVSNRLKSPTAYEMDPLEQLKAMLDLEERGWELVAVYHSHPQGPERPSVTDIQKATYPDAAHVIVSFRDPELPVARAFTIRDSRVDEIELRIL